MQSECLHHCLYVTLSVVSGKSEVIDRVNHVKGQGSNNTALCTYVETRRKGINGASTVSCIMEVEEVVRKVFV